MFYFGRHIENEQNKAENETRKAHKGAKPNAVDTMVNAARLRVLEKALGVPIKRHRSVDSSQVKSGPFSHFTDKENAKEGESIIIPVD